MRPFDYERSNSASSIVAELSAATRPYAGGTDLLTRMKLDITMPERLVDIKTADLPKGITETDKGLRIGTLTTLTDIETSALLREKYPLLSEAAALAATPQLRNRATLGGNLLQRPRCWYYRNPAVDCWLKSGEGCPAKDGRNEHHALFGDSPCVAVHPSDLASCLTALDATVTLQGPNGERALPLSEFYALPEDARRQETVIEDDELILSIDVPALEEGSSSTYLKAMDRKVWAFALVGVAAVVRVESGKIADARFCLSGVAPVPWRLKDLERNLVGQEPSEEVFARVAETALEGARPLEHNAYKVPLAKSLIRRALSNLAG
ncbi:xanthine dehydrogenase family protein subunit M [soil metagenome]